MKRPVLTLSLVFLLATLSGGAWVRSALAQEAQANPKQAEADAYKAWYQANAANDLAKGLTLAKEYLAKFPQGQYTAYLKGWIAQTRGILFSRAMQEKNSAEMIRIGGEALTENPEELDYLYLLAVQLRENEWFSSPPNYTHQAELLDYTQRAIKLVEAGKAPSIVPKDKWNQHVALGYLYQTLAAVAEKENQTDQALEYYKKAAALDPTVAAYYLQWGVLLQKKYQEAAAKYSSFPDEDKVHPEAKPEVKAALDAANGLADALIDVWAHFVGLTAKNNPFGETRGQIEAALTALYKYRHPDAPEGLQKLIEQYSNPPGGK